MTKLETGTLDFFALDLSTLLHPGEKSFRKEELDYKLLIFLGSSGAEILPASDPIQILLRESLQSNLSAPQIYDSLTRTNPTPGQPAANDNLLLTLVDLKERTFDFLWNHFPAPLHLQGSGRVVELGDNPAPDDTHQTLPLTHALTLQAGEIILLYSPGLTDLKDKSTVEFGKMHLQSLLLQSQKLSAEEIGLTISQAAWMHHGQTSMPSVTLIVLKSNF